MTSKTIFKDTSGASSILVIVMMVVLLVFGLAVLTTSLSNVRLGERKRAWLNDYYVLEGVSESEISKIDGLLLQAETSARAYIETDDYMDDYMLDGPLSTFLKKQIFALAYNDTMGALISDSIDGQEDASLVLATPNIDVITSGASIDSSSLNFSVALPKSNYDKHLQLTMELLAANPDNVTEDFRLINRYRIVRHTQQQESFEYDESIDFDDPFEEEGIDGNPFKE